MKGPFLIAFGGIDFAGKLTQLHRLRSWIEKKDIRVTWGTEPVISTPIGEHIEAILKHEIPMPEPFEFQRMFVLDRAQDILCFIKPNLDDGSVVLRERYALCTIAYGMLSGRSMEDFISLHGDVIGASMIWPDVTFLLDISAEESIIRMRRDRITPQLFEKKEKLELVRKNYIDLAEHKNFGKIVVIDGERKEEEVFEDITLRLLQLGFGIKNKNPI